MALNDLEGTDRNRFNKTLTKHSNCKCPSCNQITHQTHWQIVEQPDYSTVLVQTFLQCPVCQDCIDLKEAKKIIIS